jgi:nitroreductase
VSAADPSDLDVLARLVRERRTHKVYGSEPVPADVLRELLDLARWAPNHHLTNPWRFRVLGPRALEGLKAAAEADKAGSAVKLDRSPTLVAVTAVQTGDADQDREDLLATGVAAYIVLLAAHARGLVGYWRSVGVMDAPDGRRALGLGDDETPVGLLYLGRPRQEQPPPERAPLEDVAAFLD